MSPPCITTIIIQVLISLTGHVIDSSSQEFSSQRLIFLVNKISKILAINVCFQVFIIISHAFSHECICFTSPLRTTWIFSFKTLLVLSCQISCLERIRPCPVTATQFKSHAVLNFITPNLWFCQNPDSSKLLVT